MSTLTLTFGAGEKKQVPGGTLFLLLESVDPVNIQFNKANTTLGGGINGVKGGFKVGPFDRERAFEWLEIESPTAQTIKVFVTDIAEADYNTISGNVTATETVAGALQTAADISCGALVGTLVIAANLSRREVILTSLAANGGDFRVGDINTAAARGTPLRPGDAITLTTTAAVYVWNAHTAAMSIAITEVLD